MTSFILAAFLLISEFTDAQKLRLEKMTKDYTELWANIDSLLQEGLPLSAQPELKTISDKAVREKNIPQYIKSVVYGLKLRQHADEDSDLSALKELKQLAEESSFPESNILHSLLAELYHSYYDMNRHKFFLRTSLGAEPGLDPSQWDLATMQREIMKHYDKSILNPQELGKVSIANYSEILISDDSIWSRKFRPTLYDFLAFRALDYYINDESGLSRPADQFKIRDPEFFSAAESFIRMEIGQRDTLNTDYKAIKLFQNILLFHLNDSDKEAFLDAELSRLEFVHRKSTVSEKDSLYENRLQDIIKSFSKYEAAAAAMHALASLYFQQGNNYSPSEKKSLKWKIRDAEIICEEAMKNYPGTYGADRCKSLKAEITQKSIHAEALEVNKPDIPVLTKISYKNVNKIYVRIYKTGDERKNLNSESGVLSLAKIKPQHSLSFDLPDDGDKRMHSVEIALPASSQGYYSAIISPDPDFKSNDNAIAFLGYRVGNLAMSSRTTRNGDHEFHIHDRFSGEPLSGAQIRTYTNEYNRNSNSYEIVWQEKFLSDKSGRVLIQNTNNENRRNFGVEISYRGDTLLPHQNFYTYGRHRGKTTAHQRTVFFTDRSIYRPGQVIYFKALLLNETDGVPTVRRNEKSIVQFFDANRQLIAEQEFKSNVYGTISGSFTAPLGVLTGNMQIRNSTGSVNIQIEEYKRPAFEVKLEKPDSAFKVNDTVSMKGLAANYNGIPVSYAALSYRVVRQARFPVWFWRFPPIYPQTEGQEIASGTAETNNKGEFQISFKAIPDESALPDMNPVFTYEVQVDVTDLNGESRSATEFVDIAYTSFMISCVVPEILNSNAPQIVGVELKNFSGKKVFADVNISLHKIDEPDRLFMPRRWSLPDTSIMSKEDFQKMFPQYAYNNEDNPEHRASRQVFSGRFHTEKDSGIVLPLHELETGLYRLEANAIDSDGKPVKFSKYFSAMNFNDSKMPVKEYFTFQVIKDDALPGQENRILIGSSAKNVRLKVETESRDGIVRTEFIKLSNSKQLLRIPVVESFRGNFFVHVSFICDGQFFNQTFTMEVPWSNKKLDLTYETFRSKLYPGAKEEWRVRLNDHQGNAVLAEVLASMYDASLDAFLPHSWQAEFYPRTYSSVRTAYHDFGAASSALYQWQWNQHHYFQPKQYERFNWFGYHFQRIMHLESRSYMADGARQADLKSVAMLDESSEVPMMMEAGGEKPVTLKSDEEFSVRKNLKETAFFYPALKTDDKGGLIIAFDAPEAMTRWNFMLFAHTEDMKYKYEVKDVVTSKPLTVFPNLPRFFRSDDEIVVSAKINNGDSIALNASVKLEILDVRNYTSIDSVFSNSNSDKSIELNANSSAAVTWKLKVPQNLTGAIVRISAKSGNVSDGEEHLIPVISNRKLVTESYPFWIKGNESQEIQISSISTSVSATSTPVKLVLEYTPNPVWEVIQAIPYMMEYPYECSEQIFTRYYSNSLGAHIVKTYPQIERVFNLWKSSTPETFLSRLERNADLKSLLLKETPWLLDALTEKESKERLALLFDNNRMSSEKKKALEQLLKMQTSTGAWSWFPGMPDDPYITQYIVTGFGRLIKLGILETDNSPELMSALTKAISYLDQKATDDYKKLVASKDKKLWMPSVLNLHYLYMRTFFSNISMDTELKEAHGYFLEQCRKHWLKQSEYEKGMIALVLFRNGDKKSADGIIRSLTEYSIRDKKKGMFWKSQTGGHYWYQAPVETQALLIEAFYETGAGNALIQEMKQWLMLQKQSHHWRSTKASAEACYSMLLQGEEGISKDVKVRFEAGTEIILSDLPEISSEAGSGRFRKEWERTEIKNEMSRIRIAPVQSHDTSSFSWGALYYQYEENLDKIKKHDDAQIGVDREFFIERKGERGLYLERITEAFPVKVGDRIISRIVIRCDRDMEYVHLKDGRASGLEPEDVLSTYKWREGLGYYQSTQDAGTSFFISWLPRGKYIFEYSLKAFQAGVFSAGNAILENMYAPEFSSHSAGQTLKIVE